MSITYHKIQNFPYYSLNQFTQLQPLSRGRSPIYLYEHNQSHQVFVVKEVPYNEQLLKVYEVMIRLYGMDSIVRLRGICKMVVKFQKYQKKRQHQINQLSLNFQEKQSYMSKNDKTDHNINKKDKTKEKNKQHQTLLLFMQKCEQNLLDYMKYRRKQRKPFKCQQITSFINQTILLFQTLEKQNICHRDVKPENFLYDKGKFKLCDFQNAIYLDPLIPLQKKKQLDLTTVQYTSPQFFKNLRETKNKLFDPYKLDVYAFGITIIYLCSMGKFDLSERRQYLVQNSVFHSNYMKEQRRRYLKNNDEFKSLNTIVKMMLEQDQYKRDTFVTLLMKIKPIMNLRDLQHSVLEQETFSDNSKSQQSRRKLKNGEKKSSSKRNWEGTSEIQRKSLQSLIILAFSFFILLLII